MAEKETVKNEKDREYYFRSRNEVVSLVPSTALEILDVGCASGRVGKSIRALGGERRITGIEIVKGITQEGIYDELFIGDVSEGLSRFEDEHRKFDCIIFADVLEHLVDPWRSLSRAASLLENGGFVVLSIPNVRNYTLIKNLLFSGSWEYEAEGLLDKTHLRFFTRKSILDMVEQSGLTIQTVSMNKSAPTTGWKRVIHTLLSMRPQFRDLSVFQFIILARKGFPPDSRSVHDHVI